MSLAKGVFTILKYLYMKFLLSIFTTAIILSSCTKEANNVKPVPISAVNIVNAVIGSNSLIADLTGADSVAAYLTTTPQIGYSSFYEYSIPSGNVPIAVYQTTDTLNAVFKTGLKNSTLNLQGSKIYSLFLSGQFAAQGSVDTLLTLDNPPYHPATDSSSGIRFVNLSPGSSPVSVNIQGNPNASELSSLSYRNITGFKNYPATANITQYIFEIRDAASGILLTTYNYNLAPYQNITIAIIGSEDPAVSVPVSALRVNNF
jgi:hypothetical protein